MQDSITDVVGVKVGQVSDREAITGCTVVLVESGATCGVDIRGGAPGTRETDCLRPFHLIEKVQAILLTGGSAFGLDAAGGVMQYLEEKGIGFDVGITRVPIVPAAVIFDLRIGNPKIRPDKEMGYKACLLADSSKPEQGSVGAGCGATVGKIFGIEYSTKSGLGTASIELSDGIIVGAISVVNAFGDVIDEDGKILAGARDPETGKFANTKKIMLQKEIKPKFSKGENTTLCVVATNAKLNKEEVNKVAQLAHNGIARAIVPSHTMVDGDAVFVLSIGDKIRDVNSIGLAAEEVVSISIRNAVRFATSLGNIPSLNDLI
jgi:L-aminopeptidase/D-esterase-like protein